MSRFFSLCCLLLASSFLFFACNESADKKKKTAIREMIERYAETVSEKNPEKVVSFWADDAIYTNTLTGVSVEGRLNLFEEFKKWFKDSSVDHLEMKATEISFLPDDQALVKGKFRVAFKDDRKPLENAFSALLTNENNEWLFQEVKQILLEAPSHYEHLKDLEWLVGDWIDTDDDSTFEIHTRWDKSKNFLIQQFFVKLYDQEAMEGQQIIAWDPRLKSVRSWIFDSDGGFGEGMWNLLEDQWSVRTSYTLSDGAKASATHIYKKIDDDTYTWASIDRDVDGEILPNIAPVKEIRMPNQKLEAQ